jgi:hypothetical protein
VPHKDHSYFRKEAEKICLNEGVKYEKITSGYNKGQYLARLIFKGERINQSDYYRQEYLNNNIFCSLKYYTQSGRITKELAREDLKREIASSLDDCDKLSNKQYFSELYKWYKENKDIVVGDDKLFFPSRVGRSAIDYFRILDGEVNESNWDKYKWDESYRESQQVHILKNFKEFYFFIKNKAKNEFITHRRSLFDKVNEHILRNLKGVNSLKIEEYFIVDEESMPEVKEIENNLDEVKKQSSISEHLTFSNIDPKQIEHFINNTIPTPARGTKYTIDQQGKIKSLAYQFQNIDRLNTDNDIVLHFHKTIYDWQDKMLKLLGKDLFLQMFCQKKYGNMPEFINKHDYYEWHPFNSYYAYRFTDENGVLCQYGKCNFAVKDYWTYENVAESFRVAISETDKTTIEHINGISHKDIYDKSLTLKQWIDKYNNKGLNSSLKVHVLKQVYNLEITTRDYDGVITAYLRDFKEVKEEVKPESVKSEIIKPDLSKLQNGGFIKLGFRPEFLNTPILYGRTRNIILATGAKHKAQYAIVELDNILASHNETSFVSTPYYPVNSRGENINDRNYSDDKIAQSKVLEIAQKFEPELQISTGVGASGLPIITFDGIVVSGNNRTMSMKLMVGRFPQNYEDYKKELMVEITSFGFDRLVGISIAMNEKISLPDSSFNNPKSVKFKYPVLVRIDHDFPEYTTTEMQAYNKESKKSERPIDKAIKLSSMLLDNERAYNVIGEIISPYETLSDFFASSPDVGKLKASLIDFNILTTNEIPAYFIENGLTAQGKEFITNLLAGMILDKESLISSEIAGVKRLKEKIVVALPVIIKNSKLSEGSLKPYIIQSVLLQQKMVSTGINITDYIRSPKLFSEQSDNFDIKAYYINELLNSTKFAFKKSLEEYNTIVKSNEGASLFGDKLSVEDIFDKIIKPKIDTNIAAIIEMFLGKKAKVEKEPVKEDLFLINKAEDILKDLENHFLINKSIGRRSMKEKDIQQSIEWLNNRKGLTQQQQNRIEFLKSKYSKQIISPEAQAIIKPEWDKMQEFIEDLNSKTSIEKEIKGLEVLLKFADESDKEKIKKEIKGLNILLKTL